MIQYVQYVQYNMLHTSHYLAPALHLAGLQPGCVATAGTDIIIVNLVCAYLSTARPGERTANELTNQPTVNSLSLP